MRKVLFAFLLLLISFLYLPRTALADSNFTTDYNVTYTIGTDAKTHVSINATLTNITSNYYASSYSISAGFTDIKNITASDSDGSITPNVSSNSKGSTITVNFNTRSVGLNSKLPFNISFDTNEIAENLNNTWNINIPGIANQEDFSSFNSTVVYPSSLGNPTYIKPTLLNQTVVSNGNKLLFTKTDLGSSGISIAFGNFQVYNFDLTYHLENKNIFPVSTEIALPPTTNYQDIAIDSISIKPNNVIADKDGNWLAQYVLSPSKKYNIDVVGKAKVYLNPKSETLDNKSIQDYLKPQTYWESNNQKIISIANNLKTPYAIYQYVVKTLNYDFARIQSSSPRLGAYKALENPNSAVCLEFTDLFIALSRAAGIPAREIDGFAYTNNTTERPLSLTEDVLHAWPEYYDFDKKTWEMVDPTWGNTTGGIDYFNALDFDHFAFVVKGENSNYPIPAGGYKFSQNTQTKDVNVVIGTSFATQIGKISTNVQIPDITLSGLPFGGNIKISNPGGILIPKQQITINSNYLTPNNQTLQSVDIPPFGNIYIPFSFNKVPFLTNKADTIKITVGNNTTYKNIRFVPFFVNRTFIFGGILFVSFGIILSLIAYLLRRLSLFKQRG
jgi:transglutaminase-like putative cysteine protease